MGINSKIKKEYERWLELATDDTDLIKELQALTDDEISDAFYRELSFGTGGLRGVIGAGTNRMNIYTVAKATKGLANYLKGKFKAPTAVIGFDSRIKSDSFARVAASVFAAEGISVYIWRELMPVPTVSFAVRELGASAGIMITASHNPSKYNGYKVYGSDGCQITSEAADEILAEINKTDVFRDISRKSFDEALACGAVKYIGEEVYTSFVDSVKSQSVLYGDEIDKSVSIVYTPLNGAGLKPVLRTLTESGFTSVSVVREQEKPDGHFPTCPYPNPEIKEAMALGLEYAERENADLLLATDPDCDRVGIAVKDGDKYVLISGNELGILLLDYICSQRIKHGRMPQDPIMLKTVVTADIAERIAAKYGVRCINVLTGFKFIGEQIGLLEAAGKRESFIFGFEESYGYLGGSYVRDKDGVYGAYITIEMFAYYKTRGIALANRLRELYSEFGYSRNTLHSFTFEGADGAEKMKSIMRKFRDRIDEIGGKAVLNIYDYALGIDSLPRSDVMKFILSGDCSVVVRPSGTEPKMKVYISVTASDKTEAEIIEKKIIDTLQEYFTA